MGTEYVTTTVHGHRGKDGRCSTKSTKPIENTHRRNIHELDKIHSVQDENVTNTTVDTHRGKEECSLTRTRSKRKSESSDDSRAQSKKRKQNQDDFDKITIAQDDIVTKTTHRGTRGRGSASVVKKSSNVS